MESRADFVQCLGSDMSINILACLNEPVDVVRAGSVSRLWHHFAFYQPGQPIYSAKSVRFRLGHPKNSLDENDVLQMPQQQAADDKFIWTYTSEVYPMEQKNCLQQYKLPEPVLCIGGYLQIELLGRVQRQHSDNLFYTCVSHVKVMGGGPLCPAFDIDILEPSGKFALKYTPGVLRWMLPSFSENSNMSPMPAEEEAVENVGVMGFLLQAYHGGIEPMVWDEPMEWDDNDEEMDELGVL